MGEQFVADPFFQVRVVWVNFLFSLSVGGTVARENEGLHLVTGWSGVYVFVLERVLHLDLLQYLAPQPAPVVYCSKYSTC